MFGDFLEWLKNLFGGGTTTPEPDPDPGPTGTIGNHNSIPNTLNPNHTHIAEKFVHVNETATSAEAAKTMETITPKFQSLVQIPTGGVLTKADIFQSLFDTEKGYVNNPKDKGGETNFGITVAVANENAKMLRTKYNWDGTMRNLTKEMATAIYEAIYWTPLRLDDIFNTSPFLADKMFDLSVNVGKSRAGKWLQDALNSFNRGGKDYADIKPDGVVGSATITAFNGLVKVRGKEAVTKNLCLALISQQGAHYTSISLSNVDNEEFTWGWYNRLGKHISLYLDL